MPVVSWFNTLRLEGTDRQVISSFSNLDANQKRVTCVFYHMDLSERLAGAVDDGFLIGLSILITPNSTSAPQSSEDYLRVGNISTSRTVSVGSFSCFRAGSEQGSVLMGLPLDLSKHPPSSWKWMEELSVQRVVNMQHCLLFSGFPDFELFKEWWEETLTEQMMYHGFGDMLPSREALPNMPFDE